MDFELPRALNPLRAIPFNVIRHRRPKSK